MADKELDLLLCYGQESVCWLSGFYTHGHFAYMVLGVPLSGEPFLVIRGMEEHAAEETSWVEKRYVLNDHVEPTQYVARAVQDYGFSRARIGVDKRSWYLTARRFEKLQAALPEARFVDDNKMIELLRAVKSPLEVDKIREAAAIVDDTMRSALAATKVGVSERQIAAIMACARIQAGSGLPIDGVLTTGERTLQGHGPWTDRVIREGDPFYYEFHGIKDHYWARAIRSGVVGKPTLEQARVANILIEAQDAAIALIRPGARAHDVDKACRERLVASGLYERETFTRRTGYCMGLNFRPTPGEMNREFTASADFVIEEGMVFFMLVLAKGLGFGDMVATTKHGVERLTRLPHMLMGDPGDAVQRT
jgi:Xaa-Pro dipeptidase